MKIQLQNGCVAILNGNTIRISQSIWDDPTVSGWAEGRYHLVPVQSIVIDREIEDETGRSWFRPATVQDLSDRGYNLA